MWKFPHLSHSRNVSTSSLRLWNVILQLESNVIFTHWKKCSHIFIKNFTLRLCGKRAFRKLPLYFNSINSNGSSNWLPRNPIKSIKIFYNFFYFSFHTKLNWNRKKKISLVSVKIYFALHKMRFIYFRCRTLTYSQNV